MPENIIVINTATGVQSHVSPEALLTPFAQNPIVNRTAGEALTANRFVHITATGTIIHADAAGNKPAIGAITSAYSNGATSVVIQKNEYVLTGLAGLTQGATYYLGANGAFSTTPNMSPGAAAQKVGTAISATELLVGIESPFVGA